MVFKWKNYYVNIDEANYNLIRHFVNIIIKKYLKQVVVVGIHVWFFMLSGLLPL